MKNQFAFLTMTGVVAASLSFGSLAADVSAKAPDALTVNPNTLEATAPAGFTAGETVGLWHNLPDGTAVTFETTTALPDGRLDFYINPLTLPTMPRSRATPSTWSPRGGRAICRRSIPSTMPRVCLRP